MYICIEGNIGAGKTTLAVALAKRRSAFFLAEQFEENPLLPLFYKHKRKMAFPLEYSFLVERFNQLHTYFKGKTEVPTVADFCLYKCLWFAKSNLTKEEYRLYKKHFKAIESVSKFPDVIIYLHASTRSLLQNIEKRARPYEKSIGKKYLQSVSKSYNEGVKELDDIPVIEFRIDKYGPKTNQAIVNQVDNILKEGIKFKYKKIKI